MQLNLLSMKLLSDAFAREETLGGQVFAVYGQKETLDTLRAFLKALRKDETGSLFGKPLIMTAKAAPGSLVLGCTDTYRDVKPDDFVAAKNTILEGDEPVTLPLVYGRSVRLI